jgi:hypothetical protein
MHDTFHQQHFTHLLKQFSGRLEELLLEVRHYEPQLLPVELLDEIATTTGELMLVLKDHLSGPRPSELSDKVASHARHLREDVRSRELPNEQLALAIHNLSEEVSLIIREDKRAA